MHNNLLSTDRTALIIIDFQEAFKKAIPEYANLSNSISIAAKGFGLLGCPVFVTEQYPKGLGHTDSQILDQLPPNIEIFEKSTFSACGAPEFIDALQAANISQTVLCGVEAHICVNQTALALLENNFEVHILEDGVGSRKLDNKKSALTKMYKFGAIPACLEMSLFEVMGTSKNPNFKEIQNLIK